MKYHLAIGSHHKTGTHWIRNSFRSFSKAAKIPFLDLSYTAGADAEKRFLLHRSEGRKVILFHEHSEFPEFVFNGEFRGLRIIRDPRDVLISAVRYHLETDAKWINQSKRRFDDRSIQQVLREFGNDEERYLFEIDHVIGDTLNRMKRFEGRGIFLDVKYEELILDYHLELFSAILEWLGLDDGNIILASSAFWNNSLFGGLNPEGNNHINNGTAYQFRSLLSARVLSSFASKYSDVCEVLGYGETKNRNGLPRQESDMERLKRIRKRLEQIIDVNRTVDLSRLKKQLAV